MSSFDDALPFASGSSAHRSEEEPQTANRYFRPSPKKRSHRVMRPVVLLRPREERNCFLFVASRDLATGRRRAESPRLPFASSDARDHPCGRSARAPVGTERVLMVPHAGGIAGIFPRW
ncbi:hypothetical protein EPN90_04765 [Patescibacteria group bacterium]|nr:MAG: hypothetical protein EPN90_04765 [Patescibacteria group bacterium]